MEVCVVGTLSYRIPHAYWEIFQMVACAGGYFREVFQVFWGVTQGGPLSPTNFNMLVGLLVRQWVSLVSEGVEGPDGCGV